MTNEVASFPYAFLPPDIFFSKISKSFYPFIKFVCLFLFFFPLNIQFVSFKKIFWFVSLLSDLKFANILYLFMVYLFILFMVSFGEQKFLILREIHFIVFSFMDYAFDITLYPEILA